MDRLSVTWQQKLDKKEVEINRLQVQLDKYLQQGDESVHNNDSHVVSSDYIFCGVPYELRFYHRLKYPTVDAV